MKFKSLFSFLCIVFCVAVLFSCVLSGCSLVDKFTDDKTASPFDSSENPIPVPADEVLVSSGAFGYPLLPTDFDGIYYLANPDGSVKFFQYANGTIKAYDGDIKTLNTSITRSSVTVPVTVSYIELDGKISGFGLYTCDNADDPIDIYEYAFFKVTDIPSAYGNYDAFLLVDFDKNSFENPDKVYSEAFGLNLSTGNTTELVYASGRLVDYTGAERQDWIMLTDDMLSFPFKDKMFLSGRYYNMDSDVCDLVIGYMDKKQAVKIGGVLGKWIYYDGSSYTCLKKTEFGFSSVRVAAGKETTIIPFSGDYGNDYLRSGNYLLNKKTLYATDLLTGKATALQTDIYSADYFYINDAGTRAVILSCGFTDTQTGTTYRQMAVCNIENGNIKLYLQENLFSPELPYVLWLDNSNFLAYRYSGENLTFNIYSAG